MHSNCPSSVRLVTASSSLCPRPTPLGRKYTAKKRYGDRDQDRRCCCSMCSQRLAAACALADGPIRLGAHEGDESFRHQSRRHNQPHAEVACTRTTFGVTKVNCKTRTKPRFEMPGGAYRLAFTGSVFDSPVPLPKTTQRPYNQGLLEGVKRDARLLLPPNHADLSWGSRWHTRRLTDRRDLFPHDAKRVEHRMKLGSIDSPSLAEGRKRGEVQLPRDSPSNGYGIAFSGRGASDRKRSRSDCEGTPSRTRKDSYDDQDDYGDGHGGKRQRLEGPEGNSKKFACPFFKNNPRKYGVVRSCMGPGWPSAHRVKSVFMICWFGEITLTRFTQQRTSPA